MAVRANDIQPPEALAIIYREVRHLRAEAVALRNASAAGPVTPNVLNAYFKSAKMRRAIVAPLVGTARLAAYARTYHEDAGYDLIAELLAANAAVQPVLDRIQSVTNTEKNIEATADADGITIVGFSTAKLAGLRDLLDALIDTIDAPAGG